MLDCGSPRNTPTRRSLPVMYALRSSGVSIIYHVIKGYGPLCFVVSPVGQLLRNTAKCFVFYYNNNQTGPGTAKLRWAGRGGGGGLQICSKNSVLPGLRVSYFFLRVLFKRMDSSSLFVVKREPKKTDAQSARA
jgi:hypothetical protein